MNTLNLVENGEVVAVALFFGNGEETINEIKNGTPLNNVVQTVLWDNGKEEAKLLVDRYFLWSAKEYLESVKETFPERYTNHGNTLEITDQSESHVRFVYTTVDRGIAVVTVEIQPIM